ncbi:hypothetical protein Lepto7375DRAFT_7210 [Leptolyngbya sp. PCC 7375]|nr:hypothetical protein Lepto7375DRAFT_7210 [Leptolyngbya sp. PCC 7375]
MGDINEFQSKLYNEVELPRLKMLIETRIKKSGSQNKFVDSLNEPLDRLGWPTFSAPNISALRTAEDTDTRIGGWDERRLLRLAVGLQLDPNPVIALAILRCYLLGLIELSTNSIDTFKSAININSSNFQNLVNVIKADNPDALTRLMVTTPLTEARVNELLSGGKLSKKEINWVVKWAQGYGITVPDTVLLENHLSQEQTILNSQHT